MFNSMALNDITEELWTDYKGKVGKNGDITRANIVEVLKGLRGISTPLRYMSCFYNLLYLYNKNLSNDQKIKRIEVAKTVFFPNTRYLTPTEKYINEHNQDLSHTDTHVAFLGSDKENIGHHHFPDDILSKAIDVFRNYRDPLTNNVMDSFPIHLASYLYDIGETYGDCLPEKCVSQNNVDMLTTIKEIKPYVLLLHPKIEDANATKFERDELQSAGFEPVNLLEVPGMNNLRTRNNEIFNPPVLYRHHGIFMDGLLENALKKVAEEYIRQCQNWR